MNTSIGTVFSTMLCLFTLIGSILVYSSSPILKSSVKKVEMLKKFQSTAEEEIPHGEEDGTEIIDFMVAINQGAEHLHSIKLLSGNLNEDYSLALKFDLLSRCDELFAPPPEA